MNDRKQQIVSVDPNHVRKSLSKCFLSATHLKVSIRWELLYISRTPFFNKHRYGQFIWYFYFLLPLWDQRPSIEDQDIWEDLQNISWHAISYHSNGCANEERMPVHDYGSLHQNPSCQYEPCVPLSRNSLTWAHLNELHAWWTVVFHVWMAHRHTKSHLFSGQGTDFQTTFKWKLHADKWHPADKAARPLCLFCLVAIQHCLSPFIWAQVSLISHLNCIIAKMYSWIKPNSALIMPLFAHRLLQNKTDILRPFQLNHTGC